LESVARAQQAANDLAAGRQANAYRSNNVHRSVSASASDSVQDSAEEKTSARPATSSRVYAIGAKGYDDRSDQRSSPLVVNRKGVDIDFGEEGGGGNAGKSPALPAVDAADEDVASLQYMLAMELMDNNNAVADEK
jgi:hypothetical protein